MAILHFHTSLFVFIWLLYTSLFTLTCLFLVIFKRFNVHIHMSRIYEFSTSSLCTCPSFTRLFSHSYVSFHIHMTLVHVSFHTHMSFSVNIQTFNVHIYMSRIYEFSTSSLCTCASFPLSPDTPLPVKDRVFIIFAMKPCLPKNPARARDGDCCSVLLQWVAVSCRELQRCSDGYSLYYST